MDPQQERNWNERSDRVLTVKNETKVQIGVAAFEEFDHTRLVPLIIANIPANSSKRVDVPGTDDT